MGLLDRSKALAKQTKNVKRMKPYTYADAMEYLRNSHKDAMNAIKRDPKKVHPWVQVGDSRAAATVEINIGSMPLYWRMEPTGKKREVKKPTAEWDGKTNPAQCLEADYTYDEQTGFTKYPVDDYEAGLDLINSLLEKGDDDEDWVKIVTRAAEAHKAVQDTELPNIRTQAERWYTYNGKNVLFGSWDEKDAGTSQSASKGGAKNSCSQTARRQLGYARNSEEVIAYR